MTLALLSLTSFSGSAWAQGSASDRALAQSLFDQAREAMEAGHVDDACPKFAESQRLDPAGGTLLNLALCYEKQGKIASAWGAFEDAIVVARKDGRADRVTLAQEHIATLKPQLSRLTLRVSDATPGLVVKLDGRRIERAVWGAPIPLDPGSHDVEASAPGRTPWTQRVELSAASGDKSIEVPELLSQSIAAAPATQPEAAPPSGTMAAADAGGSTSTVGIIVGGVGLVALGVGSYFGLESFSAWRDRNDHCGAEGCDDEGIAYGEDTNRYANYANIGVGVGLVAVGVGTYLVLSSPSSPTGAEDTGAASARLRVEPSVDRNAAGLQLGGTW
jgi:hypothetical protein